MEIGPAKGAVRIFSAIPTKHVTLKNMVRFLIIIALIIINFTATSHAQDAPRYVVLENFTTKVCPDSPKTDQHLEQIIADSNEDYIILSCHVSFLNSKNVPEIWQKISNDYSKAGPYAPILNDENALEACDQRQFSYQKAQVIRGILVPQIIMNGYFDMMGDYEQTLRAGLKMTQRHRPLEPITLNVENDVLQIRLPEMILAQDANIWLFRHSAQRNSTDPSRIVYNNSVSMLNKIASWNGTAMEMSVPIDNANKRSNHEDFAIIAQYADHTDIIAAGRFSQ